MAQGNGPQQHSEYFLILILVAFMICMLSLMWWVASPVIGKVYAWARIIETGGLWIFLSDWGHYFWYTPYGQKFPFLSIFQSSVTFNLFFGIAIFVLGCMAHNKVSSKHLRSTVRHEQALDYKAVMERQAALYPSNRFFLDYPVAEEYPLSRGPVRMPLTALELLIETDAIEGIHEGDTLSNPNAPQGWKVNEELLTARLVRDFGPLNPFSRKNFPFRNKDAIAKAIDELPWHMVSIMYASVARLYALDTMDTNDFEQTNSAIDDYFKDIWRELNKCKATMGSRLVLGYVDADDQKLKIEAAKAANPKVKDLRVYTFKEYLDEEIDADGRKIARAEAFPTTTKARKELVRILTEFMDVGADRLVPITDSKGNQKTFSSLTKLEQARYSQILKKQEHAVAVELRRLLSANGFQFGLIATLLRETRAGGTLPPALFRWMRFYDYPMWSFLRVVGMNTPTPEVAGMFDHYQTEQKSGIALTRPYLVSSIEGIRVEASKYITDGMRQSYSMYRTEKMAQQRARAAHPQMENARSVAKELAERLKQREKIETAEFSGSEVSSV